MSRDRHEGVEVGAAHPLGGELHHGPCPQQGLASEPVEVVGGGLGSGEDVPVVRVHAVPHLDCRHHLLPLGNQALSLEILQWSPYIQLLHPPNMKPNLLTY